MQNPSLSVIMPALNEEKNIEAAIHSTLEALHKYNIDAEVIVVNDGSSDKTKQIVEALMQNDNALRLINHDRPRGIGYSFWDGVKNSFKDVVVMFPGDNENDTEDALTFFNLINNVDIIVPFIHNIEVRERKRRIISALYRFIINISFGITLNYTNGTVFYRRAILDDTELKNYGFFYQAELLIKLIRKGYLFAEVPNYLSLRCSGKTKALTLSSLIKVMSGYLRLVNEIHIRRIETKRKAYQELNRESVTFRRGYLFDKKTKEKEAVNV